LGLALLLASCTVTRTTPPEQVMAGDHLAARLECLHYEPAQHLNTCKVYHHVFAPDGRLLTKGLGGVYEHHRGLFIGWNKVRCGGKTFDFWHCSKGETQRFVAFEQPGLMGLADDWQVARIDWVAPDGKTLLHERRAMRRACARTAAASSTCRSDCVPRTQPSCSTATRNTQGTSSARCSSSPRRMPECDTCGLRKLTRGPTTSGPTATGVLRCCRSAAER
jgi:hypothetical protein